MDRSADRFWRSPDPQLDKRVSAQLMAFVEQQPRVHDGQYTNTRPVVENSNALADRDMGYALFFSRFRLPISAISIGPRVNSPTSAFRVSSRR